MSPPPQVLEKVTKLIALAQGEGEEARTAAHLAVKLITQHQLLSLAPRPRQELLQIADLLAKAMVDEAYDRRRNQNPCVQVAEIIRAGVEAGEVRESERKTLHEMLWGKARYLREKGILVGVRGPYGGFKLAPGVIRRRTAQQK